MKKLKALLESAATQSHFAEVILLRTRWALARLRMRESDFDYAQRLFAGRGEVWNLSAPTTYNEKLWHLKLSYRDPLLTECSDKHAVRNYVERCGLKDILKTEYGRYTSAYDIDFSSLRSPCYLKCSHGSGLNWVYRADATSKDIRHHRRVFEFLLRQNAYALSREWNYKNIVPSLVCEEYLETPDGSPIPELQFFCFGGQPKFLMYNVGLADSTGKHTRALRWVFDMDFNVLDITTSMAPGPITPERPQNFEKMVRYAETLSAPFSHVRVDLFNIEGQIYFNELTFYSGGGFVKLEPHIWQEKVGSYIDVSGIDLAPDAFDTDPRRGRLKTQRRKPSRRMRAAVEGASGE